MKYQFWNNTGYQWFYTGVSLVCLLEYQHWRNDIYTNVGMLQIVSQHWEIIILIGISLEVLFCFTNLGIFAQFPHLGKCSFSLENCWNIYFVLPTLVYGNDLKLWRRRPPTRLKTISQKEILHEELQLTSCSKGQYPCWTNPRGTSHQQAVIQTKRG